MADAILTDLHDETPPINPENAVSTGECWQLETGEAAYYDGPPVSAGTRIRFRTRGTATMPKATGFKALAGGRAYWDHSANQITYKKVNDRDFYVGRFAEDTSSGDVQCKVTLNIDPKYDIDLLANGYVTAPVGTQALGGFLPPQNNGGSLTLKLTGTSEAQKVDALSLDGFDTLANAVVEFAFRVVNDGSAGAQDVSLGIANNTHATDADAIAESVFVHLNGGDTNIYAESDDGTTEVNATDTTVDYTEGSGTAQRVEVWFDMRDPADIQIYLNGVLVLSGTTFDVSLAAGPWKLLAHLEKTLGTDTYELALDWARARLMEQ